MTSENETTPPEPTAPEPSAAEPAAAAATPAVAPPPTPEQLQEQIVAERDRLVEAVKSLRAELKSATDVRSKVPSRRAIAGGLIAVGSLGAAVLRRRRR